VRYATFSKKKRSQICEYELLLLSLSPKSERSMIVTFEEDYLRELYEDGQASDKKHRRDGEFNGIVEPL
jgi:hypothetical protein